ncbi:MAG: signal recognition particle-docking protein FtsY [Nanobdellota archaeon]
MFGYLKKKLKSAVDKFSKEVDEESEVLEDSEDNLEKQSEDSTKSEKEINASPADLEDSKSEEDEEPSANDAKDSDESQSEESSSTQKDGQKSIAEPKTGDEQDEVGQVNKKKPGFFKKFWGKKESSEEEKDEKDEKERSKLDSQSSADLEKDIQTKQEPAVLETKKPSTFQKKEEVTPEESDVFEAKEKIQKTEKSQEDKLSDEAKKEKGEENQSLEEETNKKKGFFSQVRSSVVDAVTKSSISEDKFNDLFWEIEVALLENNVAVEVIEKIKNDLKEKLVDTKVRRGNTADIIIQSLTDSVHDLFKLEPIKLEEKVKEKRPYTIAFVGVNGSGKTTSIAKLAYSLKKQGYKCVIAAADTFRAAAIQQLEEHADKVGVKLIKHDYGADPAAVSFDAVKYANSKNLDFVLIDTAGRLHSNSNLLDEMKKIVRVAKPDLKIFVGESTTGNDCVEQAKKFDEMIGIDGIILAKADVDTKGGAAISVSHVTGKPIIYMGVGQGYEDLAQFDPEMVVENLGLS